MSEVFECKSLFATFTLCVGDEVGVQPGGFTKSPPTLHRVIRITHKGKRVRLDDGSEWNERGCRPGDRGWFHPPYLISAEEARTGNDPRRDPVALASALQAVVRRIGKHIEGKCVRTAFAPLSDADKAELVAMIQAL